MVELLSVRERVPISLDDPPVTYLFRVPMVWDRVALGHAIRARGCRAVGVADISRELQRSMTEFHIDKGDPAEGRRLAARVGELCAIWQQAIAGEPWAVEQREETRDELGQYEDVAVRYDPNYAALCADQWKYREVMELEAVRMLLVETDGLELGTVNGHGLTDRQLTTVPLRHLDQLRSRAFALFNPSTADAGNSSRPSSSA